jgi:preprotein translocase subunit SecE
MTCLKGLRAVFKTSKTAYLMSKLILFLQEAKAELTRVNWPNRATIIRYTVMVVVMSVVVALFLGTLDYFFSYLVETFLLN